MKKLTAIIADRSAQVRQTIKLFCELIGIEIVAETSSGLQAISLTHQLKPGLLILDTRLVDLSGIKVAQLIRKDYQHYLDIIFLSNSINGYEIMTAVNEIGGFYFVKPVEQKNWNFVIEKIIEYNKLYAVFKTYVEPNKNIIRIGTSRKSYPIDEEIILMVEKVSSRKCINIYLTTGEIIESNCSLNYIREQASEMLVETIRGYLVNIRHVAGYRRESNIAEISRRFTIIFNNSSLTAPLGRLQEKAFSKLINLLKNQANQISIH